MFDLLILQFTQFPVLFLFVVLSFYFLAFLCKLTNTFVEGLFRPYLVTPCFGVLRHVYPGGFDLFPMFAGFVLCRIADFFRLTYFYTMYMFLMFIFVCIVASVIDFP